MSIFFSNCLQLIIISSFYYDVYGQFKQLNIEKNNVNNKTTTDLEREQAEIIKKIVSSQLDHPVPTKAGDDVKINRESINAETKLVMIDEANTKEDSIIKESAEVAAIKEQKERESIELLRIKCQQLFKLSPKNDDALTHSMSTTTFATVIPFGPVIKPEFLKYKTKFTTPSPITPASLTTTTTTSTTESSNTPITSTSTLKYQTDLSDNLAMESTQHEPIVLKPITHTNEINKKEFFYPYTSNVDETVKYVKLEPVILQRMLLSNGQNYYYWYRTVPNYVNYAYPYQYQGVNNNGQYLSNYQSSDVQLQGNTNGNLQILNGQYVTGQNPNVYGGQYEVITSQRVPVKTKPDLPKIVLIPPQNSGTIKPPQKYVTTTRSTTMTPITTTQSTTTTTTTTATPRTTKSSPTINVEPAVASPTINWEYRPVPTSVPPLPQPSSIDTINNGYKHEYKFVVPYNWNNAGKLYQQSNRFDPYAYYPKYFQPSTMNVQVPYVPTFQRIKTLDIPNDDIKSTIKEEKFAEIRK